MIQSAMMFALGLFVSGLFWLALTVALVRRTRRLTERRLLASISTRRVEFETERDELRARHAVQMYRLEREVSSVMDMATAHRLEADVNEHDVVSMRAELQARTEDLNELQARLAAERDTVQDLERRTAESGSSLRSVQHTLQLEIRRRVAAEEALEALGGGSVEPGDGRSTGSGAADGTKLPRVVLPPVQAGNGYATPGDAAPDDLPDGEPMPSGGSVVAMPLRPRVVSNETPEQAEARVADAATELHRLAGEAQGELEETVWNAPAVQEPRMPVAATVGDANVADLIAHRMSPKAAAAEGTGAPEKRFFEALAEIRALRRTGQAGE